MTQKKFISPLTDFGFKHIFGDKDILLAFLNDLFEGEMQFKDLTYSDKEVKGDSEEDKTIIYDIHCTTHDDKMVIVEMQNQGNELFKDRILFYASRDISNQGEAGSGWKYDDLKAVYSIFFTNFELFRVQSTGEALMRHDVKLMDITTNKPFTDKLHIVCLQLPLAVSEISQSETKLDTWMYNIKNMSDMQQLAQAEDMPIFKRLEQVAEYHNLSPEDRRAYDRSYKHWLDMYNVKEIARSEGHAEGRAEGLAEGRAEGLAEGKLEIATALKRIGVDVAIISQSTGLSLEEIDKL